MINLVKAEWSELRKRYEIEASKNIEGVLGTDTHWVSENGEDWQNQDGVHPCSAFDEVTILFVGGVRRRDMLSPPAV